MIFKRVAREYATQLLAFGVSLTDRLLVTAVLLRAWDVPEFAAWTVALSFAGITSVFDFGANLYFPNQLMYKVQAGDREGALRFLRAGNTVMLAAAMTGTLVATITFAVSREHIESVQITFELVAATLCLAGATAFRMASSVQMAVYRAHSEFAQQTLIMIVCDLARLTVTISVVLLGFGYLVVASGHIFATVLILGFVIFREMPIRFPDFKARLGILRASELKEAFSTSLGYWMATAPSTLLTYLPVLLLTSVKAPAFAIAQFALMRTISGFVRTVLQQFSIVLAQEVARRVAAGDREGAGRVYRESAILLTVQSAVTAGILVVTGEGLFQLWTGQADLFDKWLLWLSLAPVIAVPAMTLAQNFFASSNQPWSMVIGRAAQTVLSVVLFVLLPIEGDVLRLTVALGAAELLGLGLPVMVSAARGLPGNGIVFNVALLLRGLACLIAVVLTCSMVKPALNAAPIIELVITLILSTLASGILIFFVGVDQQRRRQLLSYFVSRKRNIGNLERDK